MAHAYFVAGHTEENIQNSLAFAEQELGLAHEQNPDVIVLRFGLFSIDDARKLIDSAYRSASGNNGKVIIASMTRVFHEAQNALLKLFEEPPAGVTLMLCVPSAGLLLPTLRSRLQVLPKNSANHKGASESADIQSTTQEFLRGTSEEREKIIARLLDKTKSDKEEIKQTARNEAIELVEGLLQSSYARRNAKSTSQIQEELRDFEDDLSSFLPILHERSAPLKLIFEHILLIIPKNLLV